MNKSLRESSMSDVYYSFQDIANNPDYSDRDAIGEIRRIMKQPADSAEQFVARKLKLMYDTVAKHPSYKNNPMGAYEEVLNMIRDEYRDETYESKSMTKNNAKKISEAGEDFTLPKSMRKDKSPLTTKKIQDQEASGKISHSKTLKDIKNKEDGPVKKQKDVAEGSLNEFAPYGSGGGGDDQFDPDMAKMAHDAGVVKGASLNDTATLARAIAIDHWDKQHGGLYKNNFVDGFKEGRMDKISHDNKRYGLKLKLMKDGSISSGQQDMAESSYKTNPGKLPKEKQTKQQTALDKKLADKKERLAADKVATKKAAAAKIGKKVKEAVSESDAPDWMDPKGSTVPAVTRKNKTAPVSGPGVANRFRNVGSTVPAMNRKKYIPKTPKTESISNISLKLMRNIVEGLVRVDDLVLNRPVYGNPSVQDRRAVQKVVKEFAEYGIDYRDAVVELVEYFNHSVNEIATIPTIGSVAPAGNVAATGTTVPGAPAKPAVPGAPATQVKTPVTSQGVDALAQIVKNAGLNPGQLSQLTTKAKTP